MERLQLLTKSRKKIANHKRLAITCFFEQKNGAGNGAQTRDLRLGKAYIINYCILIVNTKIKNKCVYF